MAAIDALKGVGDKVRGEWEEMGEAAYHIRRRLSEAEEFVTGPAIDIRGTDEALQRAKVVVRQCPHVPADWILSEIRKP